MELVVTECVTEPVEPCSSPVRPDEAVAGVVVRALVAESSVVPGAAVLAEAGLGERVLSLSVVVGGVSVAGAEVITTPMTWVGGRVTGGVDGFMVVAGALRSALPTVLGASAGLVGVVPVVALETAAVDGGIVVGLSVGLEVDAWLVMGGSVALVVGEGEDGAFVVALVSSSAGAPVLAFASASSE